MKQKSIYQIAREGAGMTRERASEYLNVAYETLASYEHERRNVPDDIVASMSELYNFNLLCYQHLKRKTIGKLLPNAKQCSVSQATIMLLKSIDEIENVKSDLLSIAYDNEVTPNEMEKWSEIKSKVDKLEEACLSIKYCKER